LNYIEELQDVIKLLHDSESTHVETVPVKEVFEGKTVWDGEVEVFDLHDHPKTSRVYAWTYEADNAEQKRHVTVLQIPPATTPENAVKASIMADYKEQNERASEA
jgi:hypothetical protein